MKQKLLMMLAALMLLGTSAMAQSETLKGDVNADGVVDVADIAAVIAIMAKEAEGETKYYWYAGWEEPTVENIEDLINKEYPNASQTEFIKAGKTATTTMDQMLDIMETKYYDDEYLKQVNAGIPSADREKRHYYIVVPNGQGIYDCLGTKLHLDNAFASAVGTFTNHTIYKSAATSISITSIIIK